MCLDDRSIVGWLDNGHPLLALSLVWGCVEAAFELAGLLISQQHPEKPVLCSAIQMTIPIHQNTVAIQVIKYHI